MEELSTSKVPGRRGGALRCSMADISAINFPCPFVKRKVPPSHVMVWQWHWLHCRTMTMIPETDNWIIQSCCWPTLDPQHSQWLLFHGQVIDSTMYKSFASTDFLWMFILIQKNFTILIYKSVEILIRLSWKHLYLKYQLNNALRYFHFFFLN